MCGEKYNEAAIQTELEKDPPRMCGEKTKKIP